MSTDEKMEPRDESEESDVEAHAFLTTESDVVAHRYEGPGGGDPERKRKRKQYEEPADPESGEIGKRRK